MSASYLAFEKAEADRRSLNSLKGLQGSEERAAEYASILGEKLKGYERILSKQKYLAGDVRLNYFLMDRGLGIEYFY